MNTVRALARGASVAARSVWQCPACRSVRLSYCAALWPDPWSWPVWVECRDCGWDERSEPF